MLRCVFVYFLSIVELEIANRTDILDCISNVFKFDHISYLLNSSLNLFPTILNVLNVVHVYIVYSIQTVQIPSLDLRHLTFLYVSNYVALLKHIFSLILHTTIALTAFYAQNAFSNFRLFPCLMTNSLSLV